MKKLKLMALGLMFLMIQSTVAVTLPSTSYTPYSGAGSGESSEVVFSSGSMITGSYSSLGDADCSGYSKQTVERETCCSNNATACMSACTTQSCIDACSTAYSKCLNEEGSLPLDGGLTILLTLAFGSGALKFFKARKEA